MTSVHCSSDFVCPEGMLLFIDKRSPLSAHHKPECLRCSSPIVGGYREAHFSLYHSTGACSQNQRSWRQSLLLKKKKIVPLKLLLNGTFCSAHGESASQSHDLPVTWPRLTGSQPPSQIKPACRALTKDWRLLNALLFFLKQLNGDFLHKYNTSTDFLHKYNTSTDFLHKYNTSTTSQAFG